MAVAHRLGIAGAFQFDCAAKAASNMRHRIDLSNELSCDRRSSLKIESRWFYIGSASILVVLRLYEAGASRKEIIAFRGA